jgi:hypothetical protein
MTAKEIQDRIQQIKALAFDEERAHSEEDRLVHDFVAYVATLDVPIAKEAQMVLETYTIDFPRWCA